MTFELIGATVGGAIVVMVTAQRLFFNNRHKGNNKCPDPKCHEMVIRLDEGFPRIEKKLDDLCTKLDEFLMGSFKAMSGLPKNKL